MSINGIDITAQFSSICGTIWLVFYISFVYLVIRFRPQNIKQRRWKASLLIGGLPVLGMPILFGLISLASILVSDFSKLIIPQLVSKAFVSFTGSLICISPLSLLLSIFATIGAYSRLQFSNDWLNRIVPPGKDEKIDVHEWS